MVAVRAVTREDADAIGRVQAESWRVAYRGVLPESAFDVDARQGVWREALAREPRPGSAVFVAEADSEVVGFAAVGAAHNESRGSASSIGSMRLRAGLSRTLVPGR